MSLMRDPETPGGLRACMALRPASNSVTGMEDILYGCVGNVADYVRTPLSSSRHLSCLAWPCAYAAGWLVGKIEYLRTPRDAEAPARQ